MPLNRAAFTAAIDDSGAGTNGTIVNKALIASMLLDPIDAALSPLEANLAIRQLVASAISGDFTTTSTTQVAVTNALLTITTGAAGRVVVLMTVPSFGQNAAYDWKVDGVQEGVVQGIGSSLTAQTITLAKTRTGLSAGVHTFQLTVASSGGGLISMPMSSVMNGSIVALEIR